MAKAGAVAVVLAKFKQLEIEDFCRETKKQNLLKDGALALMRRGGGSAQGMWGLQLSNVGLMTLWLSG